ncbi:hypothetical protein GQ43DRAFT_445270 [Delitschia confertaspora ATCC 74209]|uniref:Uncharacterized protein n=1 Tax=Delitschia confertaspora ATCC 74209 TaxID=1513339 RepID=A0A9P4JBU4_9PLEO|nr:hypothetical protein GQ43DRAFT_445270 [Delitschia confertaspora ATCC 74209]
MTGPFLNISTQNPSPAKLKNSSTTSFHALAFSPVSQHSSPQDRRGTGFALYVRSTLETANPSTQKSPSTSRTCTRATIPRKFI